MDFGLSQKVVLVSGASSGIGRVTALTFAAEGAHVAIGYHTNKQATEEVVTEIERQGGKALPVRLDLRDDTSLDKGVETILATWGTLHVLVNNAGSFPVGGAFDAQKDGQWEAAIRINLIGPGRLIQNAIPAMRANGWGRIVNVSTIHAQTGAPGVVAHTSAKSGLHGLTKSVAREVARSGILVNAVLPGLTLTSKMQSMRANMPAERLNQSLAQIPTGRGSTPEDVARVIVFLGSAANGHINGELIHVTGGI